MIRKAKMRHLAVLYIVSLIMLVLASGPVQASEAIEQKFDVSVTLQPERVKDYLEFRGSDFSSVTRIKAYYESSTKQPPTERTYYEELWYRRADVVGSRRHNSLNLGSGDSIEINVVPKGDWSGGPEEGEATANAIVRVSLDVVSRGGIPATVSVPDAFFESICAGLQRMNFTSVPLKPNVPVRASLALNVHAQSSRQTQTFIYGL